MKNRELLEEYKKQDDKILLSQILDKLEISAKNDIIEYTDFLDMYQVVLVKNFLKKIEIKNY